MSPRGRRALRRAAVATAALAAATAIAQQVSGWPTLSTHLRDDAYYGFLWGCNLVTGNGPVVSAGVTTSGVQPLWNLLLGYATNGQFAAVADFAVVLGALCHLLAAVAFAAAGRFRPAALCAGLSWLGNPLLLRECQNGQETALAAAFGAALWLLRRSPARVFVPVAVLAVLARTDLWLFVAPLSVLRAWRRGARELATPLVALLPLLAYDLALGGGLLPDSALPMPWLAHANFAATAPTTAQWLERAWWYARPVLLGHPFALVGAPAFAALVFLVLRPVLSARLRAVPTALVALAWLVGAGNLTVPWLAAGMLLVWPRRAASRRRPWLATDWRAAWLAAWLAGSLALVLLHWGLRWSPSDYYLAPLAVGGAAAVSRLGRLPWLLLLVPALQLAGQLGWPLPPEALRHQRAMAVAGAVLPRLLPPDERVACFNAGIVAFAQQRRGDHAPAVLGLDGVVDRRAFAALQRGRLQEFLDDQQVRFLLDHPVQWARDPRLPHACGPWFGRDFDADRDLQELVRCVEPGVTAGRTGTDAFVLCWRRGRGQPPQLPTRAFRAGALADGSPVVVWPARNGAHLDCEQDDGSRRTMLHADRDTVYALALDPAALGTGRLFDTPTGAPCLVLAKQR